MSTYISRLLLLPLLPLLLSASAAAHAAPPDTGVRGLPVVELPAKGGGEAHHTIAIFLTGDGGWQSLDKGVSKVLADQGIPVVGFNTREYLSHKRTPDEIGRDVAQVMRTYLARWHADSVLLVGYSRGADFMPFVLTRLPADLEARVPLVAMLGLGTRAGMEFHWIDVIENVKRATDVPTAPELARVHGLRMMCIYGVKEADSLCRELAKSGGTSVQTIAHPGDHHFDGDYAGLGATIVRALAAR